MSGKAYRSFRLAGKIHRYARRVVEVAIASTTVNASAALPLWSKRTAATMKIDDATPESRLTRTGVPRLLLNTPNCGKKEPSAAETARTRSAPIIQTAPDVMRVKMKPRAVRSNRVFDALP